MTSISGNTPEKQEPLSRRVIRAELVGSDTCIACSISVTAAAPVLALCKALVEGGKDPSDSLEAFRGATLCLRVPNIGAVARVEINSKGTGLIARRAVRAASPMRNSEPPGTLTSIGFGVREP